MTRYLVVAKRGAVTDQLGRCDCPQRAERFRAAEAAARDGWDVTVVPVEHVSLAEVVQQWEAAA